MKLGGVTNQLSRARVITPSQTEKSMLCTLPPHPRPKNYLTDIPARSVTVANPPTESCPWGTTRSIHHYLGLRNPCSTAVQQPLVPVFSSDSNKGDTNHVDTAVGLPNAHFCSKGHQAIHSETTHPHPLCSKQDRTPCPDDVAEDSPK